MGPRSKSSRLEPVAIIGSALVSRPIASVVASEMTAFSDVLVKVVDPSRPVRDSHTRHIERHLETETEIATKKTQDFALAQGWSPHCESPIDLYEQLDSLFRAKSVLIAVA